MDTETFKQLEELAIITENYIKKSLKLFSIKSKEVYNQIINEIFENMHQALSKITNYLLEEKENVITEIRQLEKQKYEILQQYCHNQEKHRMIKDIVLSKIFSEEEIDLHNQERCLICRSNLYEKITYSSNIIDSSITIIPTSILKNEKLLEINEKLNKLYSRYQMLSQVSYNICSLYGHERKYEYSNDCHCPRCGMNPIYASITTYIGFSETNTSNITIKKNDSILSFLVCNYDFLAEILYDIPKLLLLTKSILVAYFCSDINIKQKNEVIIDDDKIDKYHANLELHKQKQLKKKTKTKHR